METVKNQDSWMQFVNIDRDAMSDKQLRQRPAKAASSSSKAPSLA